jgi:hypothetical protein
MAPTLADMPVEILHLIIDSLPMVLDDGAPYRQSLKQLRQVNREVEIKTRVRFGHESFNKLHLSVPLGYSEVTKRVLMDPIFRKSIRTIEIYPNHNAEMFDGNNIGKKLKNHIVKGSFQSDFKRLLQAAQCMTSLAVEGCIVRSSEKENIIDVENSENIWRELVKGVPTVLFTLKDVRLKDLRLGHHRLYYLSMPSDLFRGLPKNSTSLHQLTNLVLCSVVPEQATLLSPKSPDQTQTLADFLALAPNLKMLNFDMGDYHEVLHSYQLPSFAVSLDSAQSRLDSVTLGQNLTQLQLALLSVDQAFLSEKLENCGETLKELQLTDVSLSTGTWRTFFNFLRTKLHLKCFNAYDLSEESGLIIFTPIYQQRPLILDTNALKFDHLLKATARAHLRGDYDLMEEAVKNDGWVWIEHNHGFPSCVSEMELDVDNGDDMNAWLAMMEEKCELE